MQYCSKCGVALYPASLEVGHCLSCGAPILDEAELSLTGPEDRITPHQDDELVSDYYKTQDAPMMDALHISVPVLYPSVQPEPVPHQSLRKRLTLAGLALAALLMLSLIIIVLRSGSGQLSGMGTVGAQPPGDGNRTSGNVTRPSPTPAHTSTPGGHPDPTSIAIATQTAQSGLGTTPTIVATQSVQPSPGTTPIPGTPPVTPIATNTPTPTTTPTAAMMTIAPSSFSSLLCLNASAQFTLSNTGGSPLQWTASSSNANYTLAPNQDRLDPGKQETVTVNNINGSGTVAIQDPNAANSPQHVTITCTL